MKFKRQKESQKPTAHRLATCLYFVSLLGLTSEISASTIQLTYTGPKYDHFEGAFGIKQVSLDPPLDIQRNEPSDPNAHLAWGLTFDSSAIIRNSISGDRINSWFENDGVLGQVNNEWSTCGPPRPDGCYFTAQIDFIPGTFEVARWNLKGGAARSVNFRRFESSYLTGDSSQVSLGSAGYAYTVSSSAPGTWSVNVLNPDPAPVPIPSAILMFVSGFVALTMLRNSKKAR